MSLVSKIKQTFQPIKDFLVGAIGVFFIGPLLVLRPFVKVRIGVLNNFRVGHFVANTELWLRRRYHDNENTREFDIFFCGKVISNIQIYEMLKRRVFLIKSDFFSRLFRKLQKFKNFREADVFIDLRNSGVHSLDVWNSAPPQLSFTDQEESRGQDLLRSMNIQPGDDFMCFHARDKAYLEKFSATYEEKKGEDGLWDYHNYRDGDINNLIPAVEHIAAKSIWALRMGSVVEDALAADNKYIIDYAKEYQSDFADVYIMSHCKFFIGNTAGIYVLANAFGAPYIKVNVTPLSVAARGPRDLFLPKKYWSIKDERFLAFPEIIAMGAEFWSRTHLYDEAGIKVVENTAQEIFDVVQEMNMRLDGEWVSEEGDDELQSRFRKMFPKDHRIDGYPSKVGAKFLRENVGLLG